MEGFSLIDVSSEDDLLVSAHSGDLIDVKSSEAIKEEEYPPFCLLESPEKKRTESDKYNLRKSLAWDSAFFTNEGVLNAEELSAVNYTSRKAELSTLSAILEEVKQSTETTSTFDADSMSFEDNELDLFEDVRSSIQKSLISHKGSKGAQGKEKGNLVKGQLAPIKSSELKITNAAIKKVDSSSLSKKKSPVAIERNVGKEQLNLKGKDGLTSSKSLLKPPRILSKSTLPAAPSKLTFSAGISQSRSINTKAKPDDLVVQKSAALHKKVIGGSCSSTRRSVQNPKPSTVPSRSRSAHTSLVGDSSNSTVKSSSETNRKHNASRYANPSSVRLMPSKISLKATQTKIMNNGDKTCRTSMVKLSPSISPASSFDSIASEVSSSASISIKSMRDSIDANSTSSSPFSSVSDKDIDHSLGFSSMARNLLPGEPVCNDSSKYCHVTESSFGKRTRGSNQFVSEKFSKPSGLKMPTPKIGYFEKSQIHVDSSTPQHITSNAINSGIGNSISVNKLMPSKFPIMSPKTLNLALQSASPLNSTNPSTHCKESTPLEQHHKTAESYVAINNSEFHKQLLSVGKHSQPLKVEDKPLHVLKVSDVACTTAIGQFSTARAQDQSNFMRPLLSKDISKEEKIACIDEERNSVINRDGKEMTSTVRQGNKNTLLKICNSDSKENVSPSHSANDLIKELLNKNLDTPAAELIGLKFSNLSLSDITENDLD